MNETCLFFFQFRCFAQHLRFHAPVLSARNAFIAELPLCTRQSRDVLDRRGSWAGVCGCLQQRLKYYRVRLEPVSVIFLGGKKVAWRYCSSVLCSTCNSSAKYEHGQNHLFNDMISVTAAPWLIYSGLAPAIRKSITGCVSCLSKI